MNRFNISTIVISSLLMTACSSTAFNGPVRPVRLSHVDGNVESGKFECDENGTFTAASNSNDTVNEFNLAHRFSSRVCTSLRATGESQETAAKAMIDSGFTLVKARCNDFFAAKAGNQGRARVARGLLQPLTTAITSTFAVINFGSEESEKDALALLTAGTVLTGAVLDLYEEQFLFDADNVDAVRGMTMRALRASEQQIGDADIQTFDRAVRALTDHQMTCTPGNILELVRKSIEDGDFRPRQSAPPPAAPDLLDPGTVSLTGTPQTAPVDQNDDIRISTPAP